MDDNDYWKCDITDSNLLYQFNLAYPQRLYLQLFHPTTAIIRMITTVPHEGPIKVGSVHTDPAT